MTFTLILAAWLALNVLATRRVLALGEHCHMPRMRIAMMWIVPFIGAGMTLVDTLPDVRRMRAEAAEPPVHVQEPAPDEVPAMGVAAFPLLRHMQAVNGYPTVDWRAAEAWLTSIADGAGRVAARVDLHRAWLEHLRDALGEHAWLHESDDALIVSSLETPVAAAMGRYVASTRERVAQTLGALAQFPDGVKSVVLVLDDEESYYHYISMFGPAEGEQAFSGGVFVDAGCPHFVVRRDDLSAIEPTIAHELTHSALSHLRLPLWVDEGLAVNTEHRIAGAHRGQFTAPSTWRSGTASASSSSGPAPRSGAPTTATCCPTTSRASWWRRWGAPGRPSSASRARRAAWTRARTRRASTSTSTWART